MLAIVDAERRILTHTEIAQMIYELQKSGYVSPAGCCGMTPTKRGVAELEAAWPSQ